MPRDANYIEWTPARDESDRTRRESFCDIDNANPFDDPDVRQRMAEVIARAVRNQKKSDA
jgi:hypothetical protein